MLLFLEVAVGKQPHTGITHSFSIKPSS